MARRKNDPSLQYTTIKVRIYPTPQQDELFQKTFGCCRYVWNRMLADQERFYLETDAHFIPTPAKYKPEAPFLGEVSHQALTQEYNQLAQAFRNFFRNPATFGHPQYKRKKSDRDSFTVCNQISGNSATLYTTRDAVRITKYGLVKARFSRRPRSGWKLCRVTVQRSKTGNYFASLLYACPVRPPQPVTPTRETTVGLKFSLAHFYVADNGTAADPPHWLAQSQRKLAALQTRLSRMQPGSRRYQEMQQKYSRLHEHIANQRRDFLHKESRRIANEWDAVCVRNDSLPEMAHTMKNGSVLHSGFGQFRELLRYKLERQGKPLLLIDRFAPTTCTCSVCGCVSGALLAKTRRWTCPVCGAENRREINSARNIKEQGVQQLQFATRFDMAL